MASWRGPGTTSSALSVSIFCMLEMSLKEDLTFQLKQESNTQKIICPLILWGWVTSCKTDFELPKIIISKSIQLLRLWRKALYVKGGCSEGGLGFSLVSQGVGQEKMAWNCSEGGLDWTLGKVSVLKRCSGIGIGCPRRWWSCHP